MSFDGMNFSIEQTKMYYRKRAIRVLPLYYFVIAYFYITQTFIFRYVPEDPTGFRWLRYILLLSGNVSTDVDFWTNIGGTWTIPVFVMFYILSPIIAALVNNYTKAVVLVLVTFVLRISMMCLDTTLLNTLEYIVFFAIGILVWFAVKEKKLNKMLLFFAALLSINLLLMLFDLKSTRFGVDYYTIIAMIFAVLTAATMNFKIHRPTTKMILNIVDKYSYCIYLVQGIVFCGIIDKCNDLSRMWVFIISTFGTAVLSYTVYNFVEKPIQDYLSKKLEIAKVDC